MLLVQQESLIWDTLEQQTPAFQVRKIIKNVCRDSRSPKRGETR